MDMLPLTVVTTVVPMEALRLKGLSFGQSHDAVRPQAFDEIADIKTLHTM